MWSSVNADRSRAMRNIADDEQEKRTKPGTSSGMMTRTLATTEVRVSGRSGSPAQTWPTDACNEEAVRRTAESHRSAAAVGHGKSGYSGARDLAYPLVSTDDGPLYNNAHNDQANNRRGHAPMIGKHPIEAPVASTHWVDLRIVGTGMPAWEETKNVECRM
jgi:hypothetical protein